MNDTTKYLLTEKLVEILSNYMTGTAAIYNCKEEIIDAISDVIYLDDLK